MIGKLKIIVVIIALATILVLLTQRIGNSSSAGQQRADILIANCQFNELEKKLQIAFKKNGFYPNASDLKRFINSSNKIESSCSQRLKFVSGRIYDFFDDQIEYVYVSPNRVKLLTHISDGKRKPINGLGNMRNVVLDSGAIYAEQ